jgi:acid phosphatase (class A)
MFALIAALCVAAAPMTAPMATTAPASIQPAFLEESAIDLRSLLGDPPARDSAVQQVELARILELQAARTPAEEKRCQDEVAVTVFGFTGQMGPWFTEKNLPVTAHVMDDAYVECKVFSKAGKAIWNRPRPPYDDPRIHPCVTLDTDGSYPSGHGTRAMVWAHLLIAIFPEKTEAILARANQIGDDRVIAGVHFPSDVAAGKILGTQIAKLLLANDKFKSEFAAAKAECQAAAGSASVPDFPGNRLFLLPMYSGGGQRWGFFTSSFGTLRP